MTVTCHSGAHGDPHRQEHRGWSVRQRQARRPGAGTRELADPPPPWWPRGGGPRGGVRRDSGGEVRGSPQRPRLQCRGGWLYREGGRPGAAVQAVLGIAFCTCQRPRRARPPCPRGGRAPWPQASSAPRARNSTAPLARSVVCLPENALRERDGI